MPSGRHACAQAITGRRCRRCRRRCRGSLAISVMISQHYGRVVLAGVKRQHQAGRQHTCRCTGSSLQHACLFGDASPASGLLRVHCNMPSSVVAPRGEACSRLTRPREHVPRLCSGAAQACPGLWTAWSPAARRQHGGSSAVQGLAGRGKASACGRMRRGAATAAPARGEWLLVRRRFAAVAWRQRGGCGRAVHARDGHPAAHRSLSAARIQPKNP